jgi:hypothetical protein
MEYFYITAPENHYDLADCFNGVYDKEKQSWKFAIEQKDDVLNFLRCSENEETDEEDMTSYLNKHTEKIPKRSRSVHRARSACVENSSDSDSDSNSDSDSENRVNPKTPNKQQCDVAENKQTAQKQKIQELKQLIK